MEEGEVFQSSGFKKNPWVRALFTTGTLVGGISAIYLAFKEFVELPKLLPEYVAHALFAVAIIYLLSVNIHMQMTKRAPLAKFKNFVYQDDGTLWHGNESTISFRAQTFRLFLDGLIDEIGLDRVSSVFLVAGRAAGKDFGEQFGARIYPTELRKMDGPRFQDLAPQARLDLLAEYDSATGWGNIEIDNSADKITMTIQHPILFKDKCGGAFSSFLAGYGETVINSVLRDQNIVTKFDGVNNSNDNQVEISYSK